MKERRSENVSIVTKLFVTSDKFIYYLIHQTYNTTRVKNPYLHYANEYIYVVC